MTHDIRFAAVLLAAALAPVPASADLIDFSDVEITAFGSFSTQSQPVKTAADIKSAPFGSLTNVQVLVLAESVLAVPFPNTPTSQSVPFASSAAVANGLFGVGVSGFFFRNSLPPNELVASGTIGQSITNNSGVTLPLFVDFFIPAPTIRFFGIGNSFPSGADPARDATASAVITLHTILTHPDGSTVEADAFDYGIRVVRDIVTGLLLPFPTADGAGLLSRFDEPDGSFGFKLSDFRADDFALGDIGPGDTLRFTYDYFAQASTGFGETGIFAAIGDPFNLDTDGGSFNLQVGDAEPEPPSDVPEPGTLATFGLGLVALGLSKSRRRTLRHEG